MKILKSDIIIIGGGLTGLALAYLLKNSSHKVIIIEARERLGGRIYTSYKRNEAPIEMGATWLGSQHSVLNTFLKALKLEVFEQELGNTAIYEPTSLSPHQLVSLPPNSDSSYRVKGGTSAIIKTLSSSFSQKDIVLNTVVKTIIDNDDFITVHTKDNTIFEAKTVISTLPPYLLQSTIHIEPELPQQLQNILESTHTWMGESIKVGLRYNTPFWKAKGSSGTIFSNVGPIPEFYDHSNYENKSFALKGFFNSAYFSLTKEERLSMALSQLQKYYGAVVNDYLDYEEKVWRNDQLTYAEYQNNVMPHQNNGHHIFQNSFLNNKLFIAGAETADTFPGYMEGAIRSAYSILEKLDN